MENFVLLMLTIAVFILVVAGGIAGIVIASAAAVQRLERNSLKALTSRLSSGELTTDEFALLLADRVVSELPRELSTEAERDR